MFSLSFLFRLQHTELQAPQQWGSAKANGTWLIPNGAKFPCWTPLACLVFEVPRSAHTTPEAPSTFCCYAPALNLQIGDSGALALASLRTAPSMKSLTLHLRHTLIGNSGAQALAALKDAPSLKSLTLDLVGTKVGDSGAHALATLRDAPSLRALFLDMQYTPLGNSGLRALAALKDAPSLTGLHLCLPDAHVPVSSSPLVTCP